MSGISVWEQALCAGDPACGTYAVALESDCSSGSCVFWMSVGNDAPAGTSATSAVSVVKVLRASGLTAIMTRHSESWLELWPASFLSVAQAPGVAKLTTAVEGFYWNQIYKLNSAVRPNGPALDLMGPWFQPSGWLYYWFDCLFP